MDKKIKILKNGPYEVTENIPLVQAKITVDADGKSEGWERGEEYPAAKEPYHLCRCGHSASKPFCDGSHEEIGFEGVETAPHGNTFPKTRVYRGAEVDLIDHESLCGVLRFCDRGIGVWQAAVDSDVESNKELAIQEACNCATGRLVITQKDGTPVEPQLPQEISPVEDTAAGRRGPLWVKGGIAIEGSDGEAYAVRNRMALCRCGESSNMPFCDASHMNCAHMKGFDK